MAYPEVIINQLNNSSGRVAEGFDFYTGIVFYGTAPVVSGKWEEYVGSPTIKYEPILSPDDIASAGILPNTENTVAAATYEITVAATGAGETINFSITEPIANGATRSIDLGTYETVSGDTVIDTLGANLESFINAGTVTHGYSASYNSANDTLTITAPKYAGVSLNSGNPLVVDETDTDIQGTITQFSGSVGTASQYAAWDYHLREYYRKNPTGNMTVAIISASSSFNEIVTLQNAASGKLRWCGIYDTSTTRGTAANITGTITQIDTAAKTLDKKTPLSVVYSPNLHGISDLSDYPDQNLNTANKVSCVISQDGDAEGALLFVRLGQSVGNLGVKLGTRSALRVSASDAQPTEQNNISDGVENNVLAFSNGVLQQSVSDNLKIQLDNYRYTFTRQFTDTLVGTYWIDNKCCVSATSSYAYENDNATIDKIKRIIYTTYVPLLHSELYFTAEGLLNSYTTTYFETIGQDAIVAQMITGFGSTPMISGVSVTINPNQKVKQTNNLVVSVSIVQNGIARTITVNVGYVNSI